jgi:hypothetical protein
MILGLIGFDGLSINKFTALSRPVQIVRQTISNLDTQISRISAYHRYEGLSRPLKKAGIKRDTNYPYGNNKPYILAMHGLADMKV